MDGKEALEALIIEVSRGGDVDLKRMLIEMFCHLQVKVCNGTTMQTAARMIF